MEIHPKTENRPDWTAFAVVDLEAGGKSRWREIGVGFNNAKSGTIKIKVDAFPLNGEIVLLPPREQREREINADF